MIIDQVVKHRSAGDDRRQIQHDLVVVSNKLLELRLRVDRQQHAEAPEESEDIQTLVSSVFGRRQ